MPAEFESHEPTERPDGVIVVSTAESPIHFAIRPDLPANEGMVVLGAYLGERLIAQDARPAPVAERLVAYGGGSAKLVYATAPEGAGLSGYLYALLPAAGLTDLLAGMDEDDEDGEDDPWSVSARAYEAAVGDEDEEDDDEDDEEFEDDEEDDEEAEGEAQVLIPLGAIKRVYRARPDSVEAEAADVLAHIVAGDVTTVDAQTVEQFLKDL